MPTLREFRRKGSKENYKFVGETVAGGRLQNPKLQVPRHGESVHWRTNPRETPKSNIQKLILLRPAAAGLRRTRKLKPQNGANADGTDLGDDRQLTPTADCEASELGVGSSKGRADATPKLFNFALSLPNGAEGSFAAETDPASGAADVCCVPVHVHCLAGAGDSDHEPAHARFVSAHGRNACASS